MKNILFVLPNVIIMLNKQSCTYANTSTKMPIKRHKGKKNIFVLQKI